MPRLASLLVLGVLGAFAHPSGHARFHNKHRQIEQRAIGDTITAVIDGVSVSWIQTEDYGAASTPAASANTPDNHVAAVDDKPDVHVAAVANKPDDQVADAVSSSSNTTSSSGSTSNYGVTEYTSFSDYCSDAKKLKRATVEQVAYTGNTGQKDHYGCNIMPLANPDLVPQYQNTAKFFGSRENMICYLWNKIGKNGGINGFFGSHATTFNLAAGAVQYVAFDSDTQGGAACYKGDSKSDVITTSYGALANTWVEWDFENESNKGASGYDASCIVPQAAGLAITGMTVCAEDSSTACSIISPGGTTVINAYNVTFTDADGIGGSVAGPMRITIDLSDF